MSSDNSKLIKALDAEAYTIRQELTKLQPELMARLQSIEQLLTIYRVSNGPIDLSWLKPPRPAIDFVFLEDPAPKTKRQIFQRLEEARYITDKDKMYTVNDTINQRIKRTKDMIQIGPDRDMDTVVAMNPSPPSNKK